MQNQTNNTQQVITFGCRLNSYESQIIKNNISLNQQQNIVVFNTCSVTKEAERQAKQSIRKTKRNNPNCTIIVTGCSAQIDPHKYEKMPEVDHILGNQEKLLPENYNFTHETPKTIVNDIMSVKETAAHMISNIEGRARAFIQVQNGCNHRCTFCIIPYGRGNSRSVPIGEIVKQTQILVNSGYNEIVITGVDITDYGKDLPGQPTLGQMLKRLLALVPNLPRLRLSSIDVAEIDDDLYSLIAHEPRLMPYFHISLQSGDDMILKRMKRRHTRQDVLNFVSKVRTMRKYVTFGADIIAGFPTETDTMFQNTLNLVSEANLHHLHVFPYSIRSGTPAALMPQIPKQIKKNRATLLRQAGEKELNSYLKSKLKTSTQTIVEKEYITRDEDFSIIKINKELTPGQIVNVNITNIKNNELIGSLS